MFTLGLISQQFTVVYLQYLRYKHVTSIKPLTLDNAF
jgi:hypothetical protein